MFDKFNWWGISYKGLPVGHSCGVNKYNTEDEAVQSFIEGNLAFLGHHKELRAEIDGKSSLELTREKATEIAQNIFIEGSPTNEVNEEAIVEVMVDGLCEELQDWLLDKIDWDKIRDDQRDYEEDMKELEEARKEVF